MIIGVILLAIFSLWFIRVVILAIGELWLIEKVGKLTATDIATAEYDSQLDNWDWRWKVLESVTSNAKLWDVRHWAPLSFYKDKRFAR